MEPDLRCRLESMAFAPKMTFGAWSGFSIDVSRKQATYADRCDNGHVAISSDLDAKSELVHTTSMHGNPPSTVGKLQLVRLLSSLLLLFACNIRLHISWDKLSYTELPEHKLTVTVAN